jgi:hypothetical protein
MRQVPYRVLGSTGERVSALGLGGWHLGLTSVDERLSIRIVREAVDGSTQTASISCNTMRFSATKIRIGFSMRKAPTRACSKPDRLEDPIHWVHRAQASPDPFTHARDREAERIHVEQPALLARTATAASGGEFELLKTTSIFDATATNPAWLGQEPERVQQLMPESCRCPR